MDKYGDVKNKIYIEFEITPAMVEAAREVICVNSLYFENAGSEEFYEETARKAIEAALNVSNKYVSVKSYEETEIEITPKMNDAGAEAMALDCRLEIDYKTASLSAIEAALNASGKFTTVKTSPLIKC